MLMVMFAILVTPMLKESPTKADEARAAKFALRLKLAAQDAEPLLHKYKILERFC